MERIADFIFYASLVGIAVLSLLEYFGVINIGYSWAIAAPLIGMALAIFLVCAVICIAQAYMDDNEIY